MFVYSEDGWGLRNVGNGPALNVVVARKPPGGEWFQPVRVPPLAKDAEFPISWAAHVSKNRFGAAYEAMDGTHYGSECASDYESLFDEPDEDVRARRHRLAGDEVPCSLFSEEVVRADVWRVADNKVCDGRVYHQEVIFLLNPPSNDSVDRPPVPAFPDEHPQPGVAFR